MTEEKTPAHSHSAQDMERGLQCETLPSSAKEAYKRLRTNLLFSLTNDESNSTVIGVTSSQPAEGKSLTSINLAYSMAQLNKKVLLIDADMRRSSINTKLHMEATPGLSNLLTEVNNTAGTIRIYNPSDDSAGFNVIVSGDIPPNPAELLNSDRMRRLLDKLRTLFDFIILDLPPVGAVTDAQVLSKLVDGMLIVLRQNHTSRYALNETISQLNMTGTKILGFVLNGATGGGKKSSYGKYGYGSYGKYGYGAYGSYNSYYQK